MAETEEKGFFSKAWDFISYPWRQDGLPEAIANSSLFPFKRQKELFAKPLADMTAQDHKELSILSTQSEQATKGAVGVMAVATERTVEATIEASKEIGAAALKPVAKSFAGSFLQENWKPIALAAAAVGVMIFSGPGVLTFMAVAAAAIYIISEMLEKSTGKGLLEHATDLIGSTKKEPVLAHARVPERENSIRHDHEPSVPVNPKPFAGEEKSSWVHRASGLEKPLQPVAGK